jgi:hypothetical protein
MPLIDPTAKQLALQKYYHYQPFCKDRLVAILRDKKLFFLIPTTSTTRGTASLGLTIAQCSKIP